MPPISAVNCGFFRSKFLPPTKSFSRQKTPPDAFTINRRVLSKENAFETTKIRVTHLWNTFYRGKKWPNQESLFILLQINTTCKTFSRAWLEVVTHGLLISDFPELAVDVYLKHLLRSFDITTSDETYQFAEVLFGILINFSEISEKFRNAVSEAGAIKVLTGYLSKCEDIMAAAKINRRKEAILENSLNLLYNLAGNIGARIHFETCGTMKVLEPYFNYSKGEESGDLVRLVSTMIAARIDPSSSRPEIFQLLFDFISLANLNETRRYRGISVEEIAECLCRLAVTDDDKNQLIRLGIFQVIGILLNSTSEGEQSKGIDLLFALCSGITKNASAICKAVFENEDDCMAPLQWLATGIDSYASNLKLRAQCFLDFLQSKIISKPSEENDLGIKNSQQNIKKKLSVYLSFHEQDMAMAKQFRRILFGNGYKVVNSVLNGKLASSEQDLLKAKIVVICLTKSYNYLSPKSRRDAELAVLFRKKIATVKTDLDVSLVRGRLGKLIAEHSLVNVLALRISDIGSGNKLLRKLANLFSEE